MSAPTIEVAVALGVPNDTDFILDDATRGVLDGTTYVLASGYNDITADSFAATVTRGRFTQLWDAVPAGSSMIEAFNIDRDLDPAYPLSPYAGFIIPGRQTRIRAGGVDIWTGFVEDWDLNYEVDGMSTASIMSVDALGMLGHVEFDAWTSSATTVGGKLTDVVYRDEVGWPDPVDFDNGVETLQSDAVSWGSNCLSYCQLIARSELGYFFASASGRLTYRDRTVSSRSPVAAFTSVAIELTLTDEFGVPLTDELGETLTTVTDGIPFTGIAAQIGSEVLFSRVSVDREGGTAQTVTVADTTAWRSKYGPLRSLSIPQLLLADDTQSDALADYLLSQYDTPRYRISEITVKLHGLTASQQAEVLGVDLTDVVTVGFTPNGVGDPVVASMLVQGIRHTIRPTFHEVTFSLVDAAPPYFRLDDAAYGVLDEDVLAF